jgi:hypothetical protein
MPRSERVGFLPGEQVMFSVDHRFGHVTITPEYGYRVAGRYMLAVGQRPYCKDVASETEQLATISPAQGGFVVLTEEDVFEYHVRYETHNGREGKHPHYFLASCSRR